MRMPSAAATIALADLVIPPTGPEWPTPQGSGNIN
jgi:hypothetical protein